MPAPTMAKSNSCMRLHCRPPNAPAISSGVFPFPDAIFGWYDLGATFFWALSGAMLAARKGYDVMGIFIIAFVSSTGGGLLRDARLQPQRRGQRDGAEADESATGDDWCVHLFDSNPR